MATLDFASLYPSIMQANNFSFDTLLHPAEVKRVPEEKRQSIEISKAGPGKKGVRDQTDYYVDESVRQGLMPRILTGLLAARKAAKKEMAACQARGDKVGEHICDGRQKALKICANSVYGYCGGYDVRAEEIGRSVCAEGRRMIDRVQKAVEEKFTIANGYPCNVKVIYGDTDSVMCLLTGITDIALAIKLGQEMADYCTKLFKAPIKLEFEKVYSPFLLKV